MCGIVGWVSFGSDLTQHREVIERMTATMAKRGPDDSGTWLCRNAALGQRRLAVIDLAGGRQPMKAAIPDGEVVLTYSGEAYNFRELRAELEQRNHQFRTSSDTEVVLKGYLEWGDEVAERLNGMYALAVWDSRVNRLVLIRDRLGVKPLYYHRTRDGLLFASEPKGILANPEFRRVIDADCLRELVGFTKASGWSLWKDVHEVEPGTVLSLDQAGLRHRTYWRLETAPHTDDAQSTIAHVADLLGSIVAHQMVADVPQCVLLSGGLDSSALSALAGAQLAARAERVRSYSVDFVGQEDSFKPDELRDRPDSPFIREMVEHLRSTHRDIMLDSRALTEPDLRRAVVAARDMPIGLGDIDTSMYLLFQAIRTESTVALSGEFADEVFGGYPWFHHPAARDAPTFPWLSFQNTYTKDRTALLRPELSEALNVAAYIAEEYSSAVSKIESLPEDDDLERKMRRITHLHVTRLGRALLDRKDRLSMAVGLEVRVPFTDHRLVSYVYNAPWKLKINDGREKGLLRQAVAPLLPRSVAERVKSPYPSTQSVAYGAALQSQAHELLLNQAHALFAIVDSSWLRATLELPPDRVVGAARNGLERVLDLSHWLDLYKPELALP